VFELVFFNPRKNINPFDFITITRGEVLLTLYCKQSNHAGTHMHHLIGNSLGIEDERLFQPPATIIESAMANNQDSFFSQVFMKVRGYLPGGSESESMVKALQKNTSPFRGISTVRDKVWLQIQQKGAGSNNPSGNLLVPKQDNEKDYFWLMKHSLGLVDGGFKLHGKYTEPFNQFGNRVEELVLSGDTMSPSEMENFVTGFIRTACQEQIWDTPDIRPIFDPNEYLEDPNSDQANEFCNEFGRSQAESFIIHYNYLTLYQNQLGLKSLQGILAQEMSNNPNEIPAESFYTLAEWWSKHALMEGFTPRDK
jgi:hypothetical protein